MNMELEATLLRNNRWAVRPKGQLGTCGWYPHAWRAIIVNARNETDAIKKAMRYEPKIALNQPY